nr:aminopeptidase PepB [Flocculibacter collagenilyticus]
MQVTLSTEKAPSQWGESAVLSNNGEQVVVHSHGDYPLQAIQRAARMLDNQGLSTIQLTGDNWATEQQWAFFQGFTSPKKLNNVMWADNAVSDIEELNARQKAISWAKAVINDTPDEIYPESLAKLAAEYLTSVDSAHISHEVIFDEQLLEHNWQGIHAVGRGSDRKPLLLVVDYNPTGNPDAPVAAALVGKGITFDSGGYSIKASEGMASMKCDMGGAATVTAGLGLAIERGLKHRVKLFLCCAENLISGHAYKLGDIITYKNGTTVEIVNTDAEGRLVLADGLMAAAETGASLILDAATLTGAAMVAVGAEYNALFGLDKALQQRVMSYSEQENEPAWPLPLEKWHQNQCPSVYADTANSRPQKGGGMGGASNAAGFLARFVPNDGQGWVHMDLASAFNNSSNGLWSAGATALGVRTIARTLLEETRFHEE